MLRTKQLQPSNNSQPTTFAHDVQFQRGISLHKLKEAQICPLDDLAAALCYTICQNNTTQLAALTILWDSHADARK
jgi:hypothetical protein